MVEIVNSQGSDLLNKNLRDLRQQKASLAGGTYHYGTGN